MNAHQRRISKRLYERAFGNHVCYWISIPVGERIEEMEQPIKRDRKSDHDEFLNNNRNCPEEWFLDDEAVCPRCGTRIYARFYYDCIDKDYAGVESECRQCGWWEIEE